MTDLERDAARYRWIKQAAGLEIRTTNVRWLDTETGKEFYPTHELAAFGTGFHGLPTLDDLVDQAMEMYPIKTP